MDMLRAMVVSLTLTFPRSAVIYVVDSQSKLSNDKFKETTKLTSEVGRDEVNSFCATSNRRDCSTNHDNRYLYLPQVDTRRLAYTHKNNDGKDFKKG